jgi:8-oxo-dGTP pyrophosphatase MutT (NUDIX family)
MTSAAQRKTKNMAHREELLKRFIEVLQVGDDLVATRPPPTTCPELLSCVPKRMTMIYLIKRTTQEVLLGHKARGFGAGNWNAFGGKVEYEEDVSIASSAARELLEESGLAFPRGGDDLEHVGVLYFRYPQQSDKKKEFLEVHLYAVDVDSTPPISIEALAESEEMNPIRWFPIDQVPLEKMWCDDKFWLKPLLFGLCEGWTAAAAAAAQSQQRSTSEGHASFRLACFFQFFEMDRIDYYSLITNNPSHETRHRDAGLVDEALVDLCKLYERGRQVALRLVDGDSHHIDVCEPRE